MESKQKIKTCVVTGATGLVGRNFIDFLKHTEVEIFAVGHNDDIANLPEADYIIHAAGYGQPKKFMEDKIATIEVNTTMTIALLKKLKKDGKFLFISTSEVYSGLNNPPFTENQIGTTDPLHPRACYIESKRCGEAICNAYRDKGYDVKSARLSLAYGEGTKIGDTRVINEFIAQGAAGKITLMDEGKAKRTYCYIGDAIKMMWEILIHGENPIYNVGGISTITIAELAKKIGKIMNAEVIIPEGKGVAGAPEAVSLDMTKVSNEFGPRDFVPLDEGLERTINWQLENLYA